jgi:hypothetical protein
MTARAGRGRGDCNLNAVIANRSDYAFMINNSGTILICHLDDQEITSANLELDENL